MQQPVNVIVEEENHILEIESGIENNINNVEVYTTISEVVEILTGASVSVINASDIVGLDSYIGNFITNEYDQYYIDCGTP